MTDAVSEPLLLLGDCLDRLREMDDNSVDSVVTDPPYGLSFMGKKWDYDVPSEEIWRECLRVLKPGGHLLAFAGTRTQHRMAVRIEDAGFEIRDMIAWVYGSGFPKSLDVSKAIDRAAGAEREVVGLKDNKGRAPGAIACKGLNVDAAGDPITAPATPEAQQWDGWGTALKPSLEPVTVARKPLEGTVAANVLAYGTGGLNIDGCRVATDDNLNGGGYNTNGTSTKDLSTATSYATPVMNKEFVQPAGRWPANLIHDGSEEVVGLFPESRDGVAVGGLGRSSSIYGTVTGGDKAENQGYGGNGSAARFFYCAKASKKDRDEGLDSMKLVMLELHSCESNSTQQDQSVTLLVDMETSLLKATGEFGTNLKNGNEWNTTLFGNRFTEQFQKECKSTTSTETRLTIESKILNALQHSITSDCTLVANSEMESGGSHAANVESLNTLTFTINAKMALALGVSNVQSTTQLKISVKNGRNVHSTVKPTALMRYLCRLITPPEGIVLDPFMGSGSTGKAALLEGFQFIGIERDEEYMKIAGSRIAAAVKSAVAESA